MSMLQKIAFWLAWNVPLGRLSPHLFAFAIGCKNYHRTN